ncbi:hypothetical protein EYF80_044718 [Liparis tanakae]|uniref:Uncharacterized protein n=1 Tax=Liparis tanakae TaxID=230148 RepID=A0A4Z2FW97_9TELE|nr:hypothetical protein EYF80_044718 [Liparis tanakae]
MLAAPHGALERLSANDKDASRASMELPGDERPPAEGQRAKLLLQWGSSTFTVLYCVSCVFIVLYCVFIVLHCVFIVLYCVSTVLYCVSTVLYCVSTVLYCVFTVFYCVSSVFYCVSSVLYCVFTVLYCVFTVLYCVSSVLYCVYCVSTVLYCVSSVFYCVSSVLYCVSTVLYCVSSVLYCVFTVLYCVFSVLYCVSSVLYCVYCVSTVLYCVSTILYCVYTVLYCVSCVFTVLYCVSTVLYCVFTVLSCVSTVLYCVYTVLSCVFTVLYCVFTILYCVSSVLYCVSTVLHCVSTILYCVFTILYCVSTVLHCVSTVLSCVFTVLYCVFTVLYCVFTVLSSVSTVLYCVSSVLYCVSSVLSCVSPVLSWRCAGRTEQAGGGRVLLDGLGHVVLYPLPHLPLEARVQDVEGLHGVEPPVPLPSAEGGAPLLRPRGGVGRVAIQRALCCETQTPGRVHLGVDEADGGFGADVLLVAGGRRGVEAQHGVRSDPADDTTAQLLYGPRSEVSGFAGSWSAQGSAEKGWRSELAEKPGAAQLGPVGHAAGTGDLHAPAAQHAAGHLVVPHFPQEPVRPEELRLPDPAAQLAPPAASEQGLQGAREGARQQPGEEARRLALLRLPLRRRVRGFVRAVRSGEDGDRAARVTGDDPRELLGVDEVEEVKKAPTDLGDGVGARLSPGPRPHPEDGVGDRHAVLGTDGVEQRHGDAEEGHAEDAAAGAPPQPPQQADPVHRRPGDLQRTFTGHRASSWWDRSQRHGEPRGKSVAADGSPSCLHLIDIELLSAGGVNNSVVVPVAMFPVSRARRGPAAAVRPVRSGPRPPSVSGGIWSNANRSAASPLLLSATAPRRSDTDGEPLGSDRWMLTLLRVLSLQRSMMSSGLGRGGMSGASFLGSLSDPEPDISGMLSVGKKRHRGERRLGGALGVPASLLEVAAAVPAVAVLAEPPAGLVVDALGIPDGGPETRERTTDVTVRGGVGGELDLQLKIVDS